jgi:PKD repeat protein
MSRSRFGLPAFQAFALLVLLGAFLAPHPALGAEVSLSAQPAARAVAVSALLISAPASVSATTGDTIQILATAGSGDPNAIITITATGLPPDLTFTTNTPTAINPSAAISGVAGTTGAFFITWRAMDQFGARDSTETLLTVQPPNGPPVLGNLSHMTVNEGGFATQQLNATDPDGDPLAFSKASGPSFVSVFTNNPGQGTATGTVQATPGFSDSGLWDVFVQVSDGELTDTGSFVIDVVNVPTNANAPFLNFVSDMTVNEGATADQTLTASDADGNSLTFGIWNGPPFMTVTTTNPGTGIGTGNVHLAPGSQHAGSYFAEVYVTDGFFSFFRSFTVIVNDVPLPPVPGAPVWQVLTSFNDPRTGSGIEGAAASLIGDKIYVSHGYRFFDSNYLSIYDIEANTWTHGGAAAPSATYGRSELAGGTALGRHYAIGGRTEPNAQVEEFNPSTGSWANKAPLPVARGGLGAASWNNKIYAVGGRSGGSYGLGTIFNRLDVYDPATNQWTTRAPMPQPASDNYATVAFQGKVYVFGGTNGSSHLATTQIYDIATNTWRLGQPMPTPRGAAMAGVIGGKIAVFGGYNGGNLAVTELYDPVADTWTVGNEMPVAASEIAAGVTFDHRGIFSIGSGIFGISSGVVMVLRPLVTVVVASEVSVDEGAALSVTVTGSHLDGLGVTLGAAGLPLGASFVDHGDGTGTLSWTPTFEQAGAYTVVFTGQATDGSTGQTPATITVRNVNRAPIADAGGPYTSTVNVAVAFDGTGSSDPDGTPLGYSWVFGDGATGTGPTPSHAYVASGTYGVALTVSDGALTSLATTTASIVDLFQARAFTTGGGRTIRLGGGKPTWCVQVEPIGGSFTLNLVDPASIVMTSDGTGSVDRISAVVEKTSVGADRDGNGLEEITACFAKDDLRLLFSDVNGTVTVPVTLEGELLTGGRFVCAIDVSVHGSGGGGPSASVSPNPLNPEATITFLSPTEGSARVRIYGADGRLVRVLMDETRVAAGYHDLRFDGRDASGSKLSSGVYFYRVETAAGAVGGRLAIVK